jgi:hypothetical protein
VEEKKKRKKRKQRKNKSKGHPITGHQGPSGVVEVSLGSFSTLVLGGGGWPAPRPGRFTPPERPITHCTGGWVDPMAGVDVCETSRPHQDSIPGSSSPGSVAIPTEYRAHVVCA